MSSVYSALLLYIQYGMLLVFSPNFKQIIHNAARAGQSTSLQTCASLTMQHVNDSRVGWWWLLLGKRKTLVALTEPVFGPNYKHNFIELYKNFAICPLIGRTSSVSDFHKHYR